MAQKFLDEKRVCLSSFSVEMMCTMYISVQFLSLVADYKSDSEVYSESGGQPPSPGDRRILHILQRMKLDEKCVAPLLPV